MDSVIADLMDDLVGVLPPVDIRFFTPTPAFWQALEPYRNHLIVEFGSGQGDLVREAKERGYRIIGCDLRASFEQVVDDVHQMNALRFPLTTNMVALACRPDHSGWVEPALQRALRSGCTAIYVGLDNNLERDISSLMERYRVHTYSRVGKDHEQMHIFSEH